MQGVSGKPGPVITAPRRSPSEPSFSEAHPPTAEAAYVEYLAEQVAQLRVDVVKRQAEIERLQSTSGWALGHCAMPQGKGVQACKHVMSMSFTLLS